jgi:hypothetical protein
VLDGVSTTLFWTSTVPPVLNCAFMPRPLPAIRMLSPDATPAPVTLALMVMLVPVADEIPVCGGITEGWVRSRTEKFSVWDFTGTEAKLSTFPLAVAALVVRVFR